MTKAIAKIYDGDSNAVIGVGFWVFPGFLLTCAHVVNQALGFAQDGREPPEGLVEIEFPNSETRVRLKGQVIRWYPADSGQREDDIAILELLEPLPEDVKPMSLVLPTRVPLVTKGYPNGYDDRWGVSTDLTIGAGEVLNDLVQLENPDQRIAPGFSGAPVWEEGSDCAVGMIVLSQTDDGVAWMISASVLRSVIETPETLSRLATLIDLGDFSPQASIELIQILNEINGFRLIWDIARAVLPETIDIDRSDLVKEFGQDKFSSFYRSFKLVKLFIEEYPGLDPNSSRISKFVNQLIQEKQLSEKFWQRLNYWKQQYFPVQTVDLKPTLSPIQSSAHLMIVVEPKHNARKKVSFRLSASLVCVSAIVKWEDVIDLDENAIDNNRTYFWKDLPEQVRLLSNAAFKRLKRSSNPNASLTVEFFLPIDYLGEDIDQWEIKDSLGRSERLGKKFRVVVRSYDRAIDDTLRAEFYASCDRMKQALTVQSNSASAILSQIHHCTELDPLRLNTFAVSLRNSIGVKITCPLPKQKRDVLGEILSTGIPLAFWIRCAECVRTEATTGIDQFLTIDLLRNPSELLRMVQNERTKALDYRGTPERRWARHLTVLWDDFDRMPSQLDSFIEGGSRG